MRKNYANTNCRYRNSAHLLSAAITAASAEWQRSLSQASRGNGRRHQGRDPDLRAHRSRFFIQPDAHGESPPPAGPLVGVSPAGSGAGILRARGPRVCQSDRPDRCRGTGEDKARGACPNHIANSSTGSNVRPAAAGRQQGRRAPAVSPDGTKAIVMDYSKGQNLAFYDFARKQTRLLTDLDWSMGWVYNAVWSPDAQRVAYLHTARTAGSSSASRRSTDDRAGVSLRGRSASLYPAGGLDSRRHNARRSGGSSGQHVGDRHFSRNRRPLHASGRLAGPAIGDAPPRLSPDGRFIAYLEGEEGVRDVHVVSLDGGDAHQITDHPADDMAPIWSPDSLHLAFTSNRLGSVSLWTVDVKDGKPVGEPAKLKDGTLSARLIDWTDREFSTISKQPPGTYTAPMDPLEDARQARRMIPYPRTGRNVSPVWSPDGRQLAFVSSAASEPNRRYVVVMPAGGGQSREFPNPLRTGSIQRRRLICAGSGMDAGSDSRGTTLATARPFFG